MDGGQFLQTRIGGVPLVAIVGLGAGAIALLLAVRGRGRTVSTGVDMLSPSSAEAFGTLQQQQEDLGNALSALGMGQQTLSSQVAGSTQSLSDRFEAARQMQYALWNLTKPGPDVASASGYQQAAEQLY